MNCFMVTAARYMVYKPQQCVIFLLVQIIAFYFDTLATFNEYTVDLKLTQIRESGSLVSQLYSTFLLANNLARRHRYVPRVPWPITRNMSDGHPLKIANKLRTISGTAALTPPWNTQVNRTRAMGRYGAVILRTGVSMQHTQIALYMG